jgi:hypothetical protein
MMVSLIAGADKFNDQLALTDLQINDSRAEASRLAP